MTKLSLKHFSKVVEANLLPSSNHRGNLDKTLTPLPPFPFFLVRETCCHSNHFFLNLFTHPVDSENRSIPHSLLFLMHTGKCFMLNIVTHSGCVLQMIENIWMASTWNAFKCYLLHIILLSTAGDKHLRVSQNAQFQKKNSHCSCLQPISSTTTFHCLNEKNWTYHFGTHMVIDK